MGSFVLQNTSILQNFLCIASVFTGPISVGDFKHVRSIPTQAYNHSTTEGKTAYKLQQVIKEPKVRPTHTVFTFMLNGSEPCTIHQINLRYIIYKAAMLVHSQNTNSENQS